jgi:hypothetical protein
MFKTMASALRAHQSTRLVRSDRPLAKGPDEASLKAPAESEARRVHPLKD